MPCGQPVTEIEKALAGKGPRLRFVPCLEAEYQAARGKRRNRAIAQYLVVYLAAKLLFLLANLQIGSKVFKVSMTLRVGIVLPLTVIAVILLLRPLPAWVHGMAAFTPLIAETALVMLLGRLSGTGIATRYVMAAGIGIFAQTLLMRAPFRQCVGGLAVALAVFCVLAKVPWKGHFGPPITSDYLVFVIVFSLPALYERYSREKAARREYLLSETNRLRLEDILRMNSHLDRLSSIDALTGVFNRRYLDAALSRLCKVAVDKQRWIGIVMIDIDHFKSINDTAGHQSGDLCLEHVAQVLQQSVRAGVDTVARYGGEEFVAILPDANDEEVTMIGERIRSSVQSAAFPSINGRTVTVSGGATAIRGEIGSQFRAEDLVAAADKALYLAKESGRNRVIYSDTLLDAALPQLSLAEGED
jgi:diguanylate cyclase (GGDEF)-like protein